MGCLFHGCSLQAAAGLVDTTRHHPRKSCTNCQGRAGDWVRHRTEAHDATH